MIKDILSGWQNFISPTDITEEVARQRAEVCSNCEHAKKGILTAFIKDKLKNIQGYYCNDCGGCPLSAKIRTKNDICKKW